MFENQPKGLFALALANTGERFGYYTMIAVFALFLRSNFGFDPKWAGEIYGDFLMLVYFLPIVGGYLADKFGYGKMVTIGIIIMFLGYLLLSVPLGGQTVAIVAMLAALLLISLGTGLFKGNLQVMVGNLYDDPRYTNQRDAGFSLFYMAINIGALFAPTAAVKITEYAQTHLGYTAPGEAYHFAFMVACASLVLSIAIYYLTRSTFRHTEETGKKASKAAAVANEPALSKEETKARIVALLLVFAVVIFFWMAFHQNGLSLTYFADEFTAKTASGAHTMPFDVINLVMLILIVYAGFSLYESKTGKGKSISAAIIVGALAVLGYKYTRATGTIDISAPIFQQFNPFYVVALTPVSMAIFTYLANKGKEPSAPRKIAYGMLVAGAAFFIMLFASRGLLTPNEQAALAENGQLGPLVSPYWLISTYLVLTFGELLLSPMGISFVSKVAPPKYKGLMMGGWFGATAIGNKLVSVGGYLWGDLPLWAVWTVFIAVCLAAAVFMFAMMKRLEKVAK